MLLIKTANWQSKEISELGGKIQDIKKYWMVLLKEKKLLFQAMITSVIMIS